MASLTTDTNSYEEPSAMFVPALTRTASSVCVDTIVPPRKARSTSPRPKSPLGRFVSVVPLGGAPPKYKASCPTCGSMDTFQHRDYTYRVCVPTSGPVKPTHGVMTQLMFPDDMTPEQFAATGCNLARTRNIEFPCGICSHPCQEQAGSMWYQLTGWTHAHLYCWQKLCLRYHDEFLEPNGKANTLGSFISYVE